MATRSAQTVAALGRRRGGLLTTAEAERHGVTRSQLSRMARTGGLERIAQGVYRIAGAPELEHERALAVWLALGGAEHPPTPAGVPAVVAAGETVATLHHLGNFWPGHLDFIVPARRDTRLSDVTLRIGVLTADDVAIAAGLPALTVERTIADLIAQWTDLSLVADVVRDAGYQGRLVSLPRLNSYLDPLAAANDHADGAAFTDSLLQAAGLDPQRL